ncbi:hypothetical protein [Vibrio coralliilyticus]|uniref:hypothetical protein n=1 Tax=Vibrio coralliilyticus TaxID=190893 RepID=UPI0012D3ACB3|nr:hypothetical protein [Vibrio coralliilyticus]
MQPSWRYHPAVGWYNDMSLPLSCSRTARSGMGCVSFLSQPTMGAVTERADGVTERRARIRLEMETICS